MYNNTLYICTIKQTINIMTTEIQSEREKELHKIYESRIANEKTLAYNQAIDDFHRKLMNATRKAPEQRPSITLIATQLLK